MYWHSLNDHLKSIYGCKVYKLSLSTGCSCPNRDGTLGHTGCIFCDGSGEFAATGTIAKQLEEAKQRVQSKLTGEHKYIAYFQAFTNTYAAPSYLRPLFLEAIASKDVVALSIATRPDCLGPEIIELLQELVALKPVWIELGLQSMHPTTAAYIRRGYELEVFEEAVAKLRAIGVEVIVHQIIGLPGETPAMMVETARYIGQAGVQGIKLQLLHVLQGTPLAEEWQQGKFRCLELEEYLAIVEECLRNLPPSLVIHRLTGDGAKAKLLAPLWSANKKLVLNSLQRAFQRDNLEQGSAL